MAHYYDTLDAAPGYDDEWQDEPLPFYGLPQEEFSTLRPTPGPSRAYNRGSSATYQRRTPRPGSPGPSSNHTKKLMKRPKQRLARRMRSQTPSPAFAHNPYPYPYPPLLPALPFAQPPPLGYYAPPRRQQRQPTPQYAPPPTRQFSLLGYLRPSCSLVLMAGFICAAVVALSTTLYPITQGLGNVVSAFSRINPSEVIGAIMNPIAAIPVTHMYCKTIGIGCGPDRHAAFKTEKFWSLKRTHSSEQISIGTDFFDCLNDLRITRQQEVGTSHLITLSGKVMQFEHLLAAAEELRDNLDTLAELKKDILYNANTARVSGSNGVGKIIDEFHRFRERSSSLALPEISSGLSHAREDIASAASFTLSSAQGIKKAEELAKLVGQQAHKEISRLHNIQNNQESGLGYLAYGWTEPSWKLLQPGLVGRKEQRQEAALFLGEVIQEIDEGVMPMIRNAMSLQQCAINTNNFNHQMERAFSLQEPSWTLSIDAQLKKLVPRIESLQAGLGELKRKDEAARLAIAGASTPSLPPAEIRPSIGGAGVEEGRESERVTESLPLLGGQPAPV
ncbi:hypothetical protein FRC04_006400 [Tulasnella sp. 424]|nr:hypothetical protein FRC04_006400 [Tulasnella sp. 424]